MSSPSVLGCYRIPCATGNLTGPSRREEAAQRPHHHREVRPASSSSGVTRKPKAISLKLAQFVVLVTTPLIGSASRHRARRR